MASISSNYITIQGWMITDLDLKGNDLLLFALIYGFSQDQESEFKGSVAYMCKWLNCSKPTASKSANNLVEMGFINKKTVSINGVTFNRYSVSQEVVKKVYPQSKFDIENSSKGVNNFNGGGKESLPNNTIDINTNTNNKGDFEKSLFTEQHIETTFEQSSVNSQELFLKKMSAEIQSGIDVLYYYHAVKDWSDSLPARDKRKKKTAKGWLATARQFMRSDKEKGKLKMTIQNNNEEIEKMKRFLSR